MPVHKLDCSSHNLSQHLPSGLTLIPVSKLNRELDTKTSIVKGKIQKCWALQKNSTSQHLKLVLVDVHGSTINVFLFGSFAEELETCKKDDMLVLSDFQVRKSCQMTTSQHQYQIEVESPASVWVVSSHVPEQTTSGATLSKKAKYMYTYTSLKDLQVNTVVDVYAVIKFVKPARKSKGTDYTMLLSIVDPTLSYNKVKCLLFAKCVEKLPPAQVGNVIRMHRLKITLFNGELQGQNSPGFSWLLFDTPERSESNPQASSRNFTFTDCDQNKVDDLFTWYNSTDHLSQPTSSNTTLSNITPQVYFDFICQVVSTSVIEENSCYLLTVWDGTISMYPVRQLDVDEEQNKTLSSKHLKRKAQSFLVDVFLFDDHFAAGKTIKPGDFIKLINLHAAKFKNTEKLNDCSSLSTIELCLHHGTSFGRGVVTLNPDCNEVKVLTQRLDSVGAKQIPLQILTEGNNQGASTRQQGSDAEEQVKDLCKSSADNQSSVVTERRPVRTDEANTAVLNTGSLDNCVSLPCTNSQARCMLETATVITAHHHIKRTRIVDVLKHDVPYKFRIQARVLNIQPDPSTSDFIKLFCPVCKYLCSSEDCANSDKAPTAPPHESESRTFMELLGSLESGETQSENVSVCPKCCTTDDSPVYMEYTYMMSFLLNDGTGWLLANLWRQDAIRFLKDIQPQEVLKDPSTRDEVTSYLTQLSPHDGKLPWLECCICSYTGLSGVCYRIFDTTVA